MLRRLLTLSALALTAAAAPGQDPQSLPFFNRPAQEPWPSWRADVVAGLPLTVRVQGRVADLPLWLEGGGGLFIVVPTAFAGVRAELDRGLTERHGLVARPGVDGYYLPPTTFGQLGSSEATGLLSADVDLVWRYRWAGRLGSEFGVKVGIGYLPKERMAFPVAGLLFGIGF